MYKDTVGSFKFFLEHYGYLLFFLLAIFHGYYISPVIVGYLGVGNNCELSALYELFVYVPSILLIAYAISHINGNITQRDDIFKENQTRMALFYSIFIIFTCYEFSHTAFAKYEYMNHFYQGVFSLILYSIVSIPKDTEDEKVRRYIFRAFSIIFLMTHYAILLAR